jgi:DNA polymerase III epsilon subunit family exonuclease
MRFERKLTLAVLALFVPPTAVAGLVLLLLYRRGALQEPSSLLTAVLIGLAALMSYLALVTHGLARSLSRTVKELRHGVELIATVNPGHRLRIDTGDELQALGEDINRLAELLDAARKAGTPGPSARAPRPELLDLPRLDEMAPPIEPGGGNQRLADLTFVAFDTETTGLRPEGGDRVVSLAGVWIDRGQVRRDRTFHALVDPGRPVPPESTRIHGLDGAALAGAPRLDAVLPAFLDFARDAVLVGHDVSFDLRFLVPEAARLELRALSGRPVLDTGLLSRSLHGPGEEHTLEAVAARLGVPVVGRHSALGDALMTAELFVRLLALLSRRGVHTLGQALDAMHRARTPII